MGGAFPVGCICFYKMWVPLMQPDEYVLLGAALALQIAEGLCDDELEAAAALYTVIGDQLALIAVARARAAAQTK